MTTPWIATLTPSEQQRRERAHRIECANCRSKALRELERDVRRRIRNESTPEQPTGDAS